MIVYVHGCSTCGINSIYIRKVKKYCQDNEIDLSIRNSKYSEEYAMEHLLQLSLAGLAADSYQPIVVEGNKITKLGDFNR